MCSAMAGMMALTAASGYANYRAQQQAADAQAASYEAQAQAAQRNAQIENRKQEQIADNYAQQQTALRARQRLSEGAQRAEVGSAGIGFSGSAMDILSSGVDAYRQDSMNLLANQRNDNYSSRVTESNYINQAASMQTAAANTRKTAKMQGIATILGTAAAMYGTAQPWKNTGSSGGGSSSQVGFSTTPVGYGVEATFTPRTGRYTFARQGENYFSMNRNQYTFNNRLTY